MWSGSLVVWEPLLYINTLHVFSGIVPTTFGLGGQWPAWGATPWGHCSRDGWCTKWWTNGSTKGSHKSPGTLSITWLRHLPSYCPVCPALTRLTVSCHVGRGSEYFYHCYCMFNNIFPTVYNKMCRAWWAVCCKLGTINMPFDYFQNVFILFPEEHERELPFKEHTF